MMVDERETWQNLNAGDVYIDVADPYVPNAHRSHRIGPGDMVSITIAERQFNQRNIPKKDYDLFTNGTLTPVKLIDTAADFEEIALSPNVKSETDLRDLFKLTASKFKTEIAEIDNQRILERLIELSEDDSTNVSLSQRKAIEARLDAIRPDLKTERSLGDQTVSRLPEKKLASF
ncbi:hypothetical protein EKI60_04620 [Candidatus Saccharibacteria bacterium]|nr:MAG: hypothetical protein EKI60_04620 [Candidatus Saccharibacteria bacterium]